MSWLVVVTEAEPTQIFKEKKNKLFILDYEQFYFPIEQKKKSMSNSMMYHAKRKIVINLKGPNGFLLVLCFDKYILYSP